MAMRLALAVGRIDVDRMLDELEPKQFAEWIAFYKIEPFGDWWRAGAKLAAVLGGKPAYESFGPAGTDLNQTAEVDIEKVLESRYGNGRNHRRSSDRGHQ